MNKRSSLNGSDWLFKDFYSEDWRWRGSHLPDSRDRHAWRFGSVPGCPHHDLWRLGEIPDLLNDLPLMLVLKSGSFGKPDFFVRALEHLRNS